MARRKSINVKGYSHANPIPAGALVGGLLATGLITGRDPVSGKMPATLAEQVTNMFGHVTAIVEAAGGTMEEIVKLNVFMHDRSQRAALNDIWLKLFPDENNRPARHTQQVELDGGQLIQCDFMAMVGGK